MPKSKRDKKISLTKTDKKGLALKQKVVEDVRNCVGKFNSIYAFSYKNLRTERMQDVRQDWKPSRFFFGKNKVIGVALGKTPEDEVGDDLHKLSKCLKGQGGLLFTDHPKEEVLEWFKGFSIKEFARAGFKVKKTISLNKGPMAQFSHSIEPYLRQLGMPTKLDRGVVTLIKDYEVCKAGAVLKPEQAKILELLEYKLATFHFTLKACWIKDKGFEKLHKLIDEEGEAEEEKPEEHEEEEDMLVEND